MVEIFYKTGSSDEDPDEKAEYYMLMLFSDEPNSFLVSKHHAFWSDSLEEPILHQIVLNTKEEPLSYGDAKKLYAEQKAYLVTTGFARVFVPVPLPPT